VSGKDKRGPFLRLSATYPKALVAHAALKAKPGDPKIVTSLRMQATLLAPLSTATKKDVTFEVWIGANGKVRRTMAGGEGLDAAAVKRLSLNGREEQNKQGAGRYFRFTVPGAEIVKMRESATHMREMAPRPTAHERRPMPPKEK